VTVHPAAAAGFANAAEDYERSRPSYPAAAVDHLVAALALGPGRTVVDVAAGTGKLTRLLVACGASVVAVEPVEQMRAILQAKVPEATVVDGTAEQLPVAEADAITVAQAFHWFDGAAALAAFRRVLPQGGRVAVVYNLRDPAPAWLEAINALTRPYRQRVPQREDGNWSKAFGPGCGFTPLATTEFDNPHTLAVPDVVGRFRSLSFIGALAPPEQERVLGDIAALLASHPATRGRDEIVIPQRTAVSVCTRL
jgi:SAM-dependent methyltransferase